MKEFFANPNLPSRNVNTLIIGEDYCRRLRPALSRLGIHALSCPKNPDVDERLASHADLSVFHCGGARFVLAEYLYNTDFARELEAMGAVLSFAESEQGRTYPKDANLCALSIGKHIFHNEKVCDIAIRKNTQSLTHTAQGYAKCAVCAVSEKAVITADEGMAGVLENKGVSVLRITSKGVALEGYPDGFIGGAAFKLAPDLIAFTGSITLHPDGDEIESFLRLQGIRTVCLTNEQVFDIGSAIPII